MWRKTIIRLFNRLTRFSLIVHYLLKLCITSHLFWLRSDFGPLWLLYSTEYDSRSNQNQLEANLTTQGTEQQQYDHTLLMKEHLNRDIWSWWHYQLHHLAILRLSFGCSMEAILGSTSASLLCNSSPPSFSSSIFLLWPPSAPSPESSFSCCEACSLHISSIIQDFLVEI